VSRKGLFAVAFSLAVVGLEGDVVAAVEELVVTVAAVVGESFILSFSFETKQKANASVSIYLKEYAKRLLFRLEFYFILRASECIAFFVERYNRTRNKIR
jgi:hypothetical protein